MTRKKDEDECRSCDLRETIDRRENENAQLAEQLAALEVKFAAAQRAQEGLVCSICGERRPALEQDEMGDFCDYCAERALLFYRVWALRQRLANLGADVGTVGGHPYVGIDQ
jgi:hypothetical protein